jgi:predicted nucleic acid binding AN1-type Zn finger protein
MSTESELARLSSEQRYGALLCCVITIWLAVIWFKAEDTEKRLQKLEQREVAKP